MASQQENGRGARHEDKVQAGNDEQPRSLLGKPPRSPHAEGPRSLPAEIKGTGTGAPPLKSSLFEIRSFNKIRGAAERLNASNDTQQGLPWNQKQPIRAVEPAKKTDDMDDPPTHIPGGSLEFSFSTQRRRDGSTERANAGSRPSTGAHGLTSDNPSTHTTGGTPESPPNKTSSTHGRDDSNDRADAGSRPSVCAQERTRGRKRSLSYVIQTTKDWERVAVGRSNSLDKKPLTAKDKSIGKGKDVGLEEDTSGESNNQRGTNFKEKGTVSDKVTSSTKMALGGKSEEEKHKDTLITEELDANRDLLCLIDKFPFEVNAHVIIIPDISRCKLLISGNGDIVKEAISKVNEQLSKFKQDLLEIPEYQIPFYEKSDVIKLVDNEMTDQKIQCLWKIDQSKMLVFAWKRESLKYFAEHLGKLFRYKVFRYDDKENGKLKQLCESEQWGVIEKELDYKFGQLAQICKFKDEDGYMCLGIIAPKVIYYNIFKDLKIHLSSYNNSMTAVKQLKSAQSAEGSYVEDDGKNFDSRLEQGNQLTNQATREMSEMPDNEIDQESRNHDNTEKHLDPEFNIPPQSTEQMGEVSKRKVKKRDANTELMRDMSDMPDNEIDQESGKHHHTGKHLDPEFVIRQQSTEQVGEVSKTKVRKRDVNAEVLRDMSDMPDNEIDKERGIHDHTEKHADPEFNIPQQSPGQLGEVSKDKVRKRGVNTEFIKTQYKEQEVHEETASSKTDREHPGFPDTDRFYKAGSKTDLKPKCDKEHKVPDESVPSKADRDHSDAAATDSLYKAGPRQPSPMSTEEPNDSHLATGDKFPDMKQNVANPPDSASSGEQENISGKQAVFDIHKEQMTGTQIWNSQTSTRDKDPEIDERDAELSSERSLRTQQEIHETHRVESTRPVNAYSTKNPDMSEKAISILSKGYRQREPKGKPETDCETEVNDKTSLEKDAKESDKSRSGYKITENPKDHIIKGTEPPDLTKIITTERNQKGDDTGNSDSESNAEDDDDDYLDDKRKDSGEPTRENIHQMTRSLVKLTPSTDILYVWRFAFTSPTVSKEIQKTLKEFDAAGELYDDYVIVKIDCHRPIQSTDKLTQAISTACKGICKASFRFDWKASEDIEQDLDNLKKRKTTRLKPDNPFKSKEADVYMVNVSESEGEVVLVTFDRFFKMCQNDVSLIIKQYEGISTNIPKASGFVSTEGYTQHKKIDAEIHKPNACGLNKDSECKPRQTWEDKEDYHGQVSVNPVSMHCEKWKYDCLRKIDGGLAEIEQKYDVRVSLKDAITMCIEGKSKDTLEQMSSHIGKLMKGLVREIRPVDVVDHAKLEADQNYKQRIDAFEKKYSIVMELGNVLDYEEDVQTSFGGLNVILSKPTEHTPPPVQIDLQLSEQGFKFVISGKEFMEKDLDGVIRYAMNQSIGETMAILLDDYGEQGPKATQLVSALISWFKDTNKQRGSVYTLYVCTHRAGQWFDIKDMLSRYTHSTSSPLSTCKTGLSIGIEIVLGELAKQKVDVLVNSTNGSLDLNHGAVSSSLLKAAGRGMQSEIHKNYPNKIKPGQIAETGGHRLNSKHVLHLCLHDWNTHSSEKQDVCKKTLHASVYKCLRRTQELKCKSIAFPALGAGVLKYPLETIASEMITTIHQYNRHNPESCIEKVLIVIYTADQHIFQVFKTIQGEVNETEYEKALHNEVPEKCVVIAGKKENVANAKDRLMSELLSTHTPGLEISGRFNTNNHATRNALGNNQELRVRNEDNLPLTPISANDGDADLGNSRNKATVSKEDTATDSGHGFDINGAGAWRNGNTNTIVENENYDLTSDNTRGRERPVSERHRYAEVSNIGVPNKDGQGGDYTLSVRKTQDYVAEQRTAKDILNFPDMPYGFETGLTSDKGAIPKTKGIKGRPADLSNPYRTARDDTASRDIDSSHVSDDVQQVRFPGAIGKRKGRQRKYKIHKVDSESVEILDQFLEQITVSLNRTVMEKIKRPKLDALKKNLKKYKNVELDLDSFTLQGKAKDLFSTEEELSKFINRTQTSDCALSQEDNDDDASADDDEDDDEEGDNGIDPDLEQTYFEMTLSHIDSKTSQLRQIKNVRREVFIFLKVFYEKEWMTKLQRCQVDFYNGEITIQSAEDVRMAEASDFIKSGIDKLDKFYFCDIVSDKTVEEVMSTCKHVKDNSKTFNNVYVYEDDGVVRLSGSLFEQVDEFSKVVCARLAGIQPRSRANRKLDVVSDEVGLPTLRSETSFVGPSHDQVSRGFLPEMLKGCKSFLTDEGLKVYVYKADILQLQVDGIVNAANSELKHGGGIAKVIANAAGPAFDKESENYIARNGPLYVGESCVTTAGSLNYKCVIHTVGPCMSDYRKDQVDDVNADLYKAIYSSLEEARKVHLKSVGIPSVSSGVFGVPKRWCSMQYCLAVKNFSKRNSSCCLKEIHFIDIDDDMLNIIALTCDVIFNGSGKAKKELKKLKPETYKNTKTKIRQFLQKNKNYRRQDSKESFPKIRHSFRSKIKFELRPKFQVAVRKGNIVDFEKGVIVCIQDAGLKCQSGVAKAIIQEYSLYKGSLHQRYTKRSYNIGEVLVCPCKSLRCSLVYNVIVHEEGRHPDMSNASLCYTQVLQKADTHNVEKIALPLITAGRSERSVEESAKALYSALVSFANSKEVQHKFPSVYIYSIKEGDVEVLIKVLKDLLMEKKPERATQCNYDDESEKFFAPSSSPIYRRRTERHNSHDSMRSDGSDNNTSYSLERKPRDPSVNSTEEISVERSDRIDTDYGGSSSKPDVADDSKSDGSVNNAEKPLESLKCTICMDSFDNPKTLSKCGHTFCTECIDSYFKVKPVCPCCSTVYGVLNGTQPKDGKMDDDTRRYTHLPGYEKDGCIRISYNFPDGLQGEEHPDPGKRYHGTRRTAYLPDNRQGRKVLKLLQVAFKRRLVFTIGRSVTTGLENVVTWNDIHHKTNTHGGPSNFGYPDNDYLARVTAELAAKGVTEDDLE